MSNLSSKTSIVDQWHLYILEIYFRAFKINHYRVSSKKKTSWFLARNFLLASDKNKFSVLFERERFNNCSAEFSY